MEDWSLQAIVRGSSGDFEKNISDDHIDMGEYQNRPFSDDDDVVSGPTHQFDGEFLVSFPDELEDLYKPFYPTAGNSVPAKATAVVEFQEQNVVQDKLQTDDNKSDQSSETDTGVAAVTCAPKYKRRKIQHKRVVIQVSAEGLSSDMWAWRKYGQKPIKGSPYPRSYYRCSSSKGCLARKQVEQSCTDPGMYIITYTAEHSHSQPTRRNSLAGTVRQKFPTASPSKTMSQTLPVKQENLQEECGSPKPITHQLNHSCASSDDAVTTTFDPIKEESKFEEDHKQLDGDLTSSYYGDIGDDFMIPGFKLNDDFFLGLEEFDEFVWGLQQAPVCHASAQ